MYCSKCGTEITDGKVCPKCGSVVGVNRTNVVLRILAKVFMLVSCIITGFFIIPLAWTIPMTVKYWKKVKAGEQVSIAFKVCSLIFVSTTAGILMLCDLDN